MFVRKLSFSIVFLLGFLSISAQNGVIKGVPVNTQDFSSLYDKFEHFDLYQLPTATINNLVTSENEDNQLRLELGSLNWEMALYPHDLRGPSYQAVTEVNGETRPVERIGNITYRGELTNQLGSDVRIAITDKMILGSVTTPNAEYFIENLNYVFDDAPSDIFIVYEANSVIPDKNVSCGMDDMHRITQGDHEPEPEPEQETEGAMACYEVIIALGCDVDYTNRYGGTGGAQGRMIGILNLVQTNYDNEFRDEIDFVLGPTFMATGSNPATWSFSSINALLQTFRNWANGNGFGSTAYDVSTLWFRRNFGGVIGLAWLRALCGGNRYNVCRDFTSNTTALRVLQSHELGHNFGFSHDASGSPYIMAPAVNSSNLWSGQSQGQFNSRVPYSCMGPCLGGVPPIADFDAVPTDGCKPMVVRFTDQSLNTPTQWRWSFPGGTPNSSTQPNPTVTYNTPGDYPVTLEVSNLIGASTEIKNNYISVGDIPIANFDANVLLDEVFFIDRSIVFGAPQYLWSFGDGNFANDPNPTHVYDEDGIYLVVLTVTTSCGSTQFSTTVEIVTPPEGEFSALPTEGCVGSVVEFTDESSENVDTYSWKFDGGTPGTSSVENPVIVYDTAGTFKVTLVLSNSRYQTKVEKTGYITIDSSARADFTADVNDLEVMFMDSSDHGRDYDWYFGDGGRSNQKNPTRTYTKDSLYEVTLITTNFCDEDTIVKTVAVGSLPSASFTADKQIDCLPGEITFEDESSDNTTRRVWKFEGGTPASSTEASPTVAYDQTGEFKVTLIAINGLGTDTLIEEKYVTIEDQPEADFDFIRNGYDIEFMSNSEGGTTWSWDFGDGNSSTEENPMHMYGGDGDYDVILITTNNCGADTVSKTLSISNSPNANFTADANVGCVPMTVNLENQSSDNTTEFEWMIPGGNPGNTTEENPTITFNNPGLYRVTLIAKNTFGNDTVVKQDFIEVLDVPEAGFNFDLNGFSIDFSQDAKYGKEFEWSFGDGATSDLENPTHVYTDEGEFEVILVVKNICGTDTVRENITVTPRPILAFDLDKAEICKENTITYSDMTENDPTDWLWKFEGGTPATSTDQNPTVTYNTSGTYDVILEATNSFGTTVDTFQQLVRVFDEPIAAYDYMEQGVRINFVNTSEEYGDFMWDFGDGNSSTEFEPSHLYSLPGTYEVELSVTNECGVDIYKQEIAVKHRDIDFTILPPPPAPNPSNGMVTVTHVGTPAPFITLFIAGVDGQMQELYKGNFMTGKMTKTLDLTDFDSGTYMIFYKTNNDLRMSKIVLQD